MRILSYSYKKALQYSKSKFSIYWLCFTSFLESFILPFPLQDILLILMSINNIKKSYKYALLCTFSSVIGALIGYLIGLYASNFVMDVMTNWGYLEDFNQAKNWVTVYGFWILIIASISPIPYKIFTIVAGIMSMAIIPFIIVSFIARGLRYYFIAFLVKKFGKNVNEWLIKYIDKFNYLIIIVIIVIIIYIYYVQ